MAVPGMGPMAGTGDIRTAPFLVSDGDRVTALIELPATSFDRTTMRPGLDVGSGQPTVTVR
ncbi:MAG: hypothetical protein D6718_06565 [Acidobacteria bacterium]|nr:MAG: hypothetical protein D6718_06565 [Acidobacteriota bacterium]